MEEVVSLLLGRIQIWKCVTDKTFMIVLPSLQKQKKKNNTTPFVSGDCLLSSYCGLMEVLLLFKNNALIPFTAHIFLHYPPVRIA